MNTKLTYYVPTSTDYYGIAGEHEAACTASVEKRKIEEAFPDVEVELVAETFSFPHRNNPDDQETGELVQEIEHFVERHTGDWYDEVLAELADDYKNRDDDDVWDEAEIEQLQEHGKI